MILTTKRHGRTGRDVRNLLAHLNKRLHQTSRVIRIGGVPVSNADDVLTYMQMMRDASRATVAMHHITISPCIRLSDAQFEEAVQRILWAMNAHDHPYILWKHGEKRRSSGDVADEHYHLVVGHVGPDGRALKDSLSFVKLEAAARTMEADFGELITGSRFTKSVVKELQRIGRDDVAEMLSAPPSPPASAMSSATRARAERRAIDLPKMQAAVRSAWISSDSPVAFRSALAELELNIIAGSRPNVYLVMKDGTELGALDRIVRQKRAAVAARMEGDHGRGRTKEATQRGRSDLLCGSRRSSAFAEPATIAPASGDGRDRRWTGSIGRNDRSSERNTNDSLTSRRKPESHRERAFHRAAAVRIGRHDAFRELRQLAEAISAKRQRPKSLHCRLLYRRAAASIAGKDLADLKTAALRLAAGSMLSDSVLGSLEVTSMRSLKPAKNVAYKAQLLAEIAPQGVNVGEFSGDVHMVKKPSPENPVARVMMADGGWCEVDTSSGKTVRTWGTIGRAQDLARAFAEGIGCEVTHLSKTAAMGAAGEALRIVKQSEDAIQSLARWWIMRGFTAIAAVDGCWIDVGHSRIRDTGDLLEIHGGLTHEAVAAAVMKAKEAWNGSMILDGIWSQSEQDHIWIEAQRHGVEVRNCHPSETIRKTWRREREAALEQARTISAVDREASVARDLVEAAKGDRDAAARLPGSLQAFVAIHLDDEQRARLAAQSIDGIIPELNRFRQLGATELEAYEKDGRTLIMPKPEGGDRGPENAYSPR